MAKDSQVYHYFVDEAGDTTLFNKNGKIIVGNPGVSIWRLFQSHGATFSFTLRRSYNTRRCFFTTRLLFNLAIPGKYCVLDFHF